MSTIDVETDVTFLISPSEPAALRSIGVVSSSVEKKGCDVIIMLPDSRVGIQRKTWVDLVISLDDGRLANSIPLMDMMYRIILLEGKPTFDTADHMMVRSRNKKAVHGWAKLRHTRESLAGVCFSLRYVHGLDVMRSESLSDTIMMVRRLGRYLSKTDHRGIMGDRPRVPTARDFWGVEDAGKRRLAQKINFLMGLGMGYKTAINLLKASKGRIPLQWTMKREELINIPLIGASTADRLIRFLD